MSSCYNVKSKPDFSFNMIRYNFLNKSSSAVQDLIKQRDFSNESSSVEETFTVLKL